ncbi:hypothetical protein PAJ34TS1_26300 [Paenibacillus azoreducens]|uniref:Uncharacterized protein n=1 Tax=Paenibacillus azoreducens TaxID=116718 RepID=A0A919Y8R5_9BACL|nr:hypothetical protein J34TS1_09810 [Paenibacillus azoreducens]
MLPGIRELRFKLLIQAIHTATLIGKLLVRSIEAWSSVGLGAPWHAVYFYLGKHILPQET